MSHEQACLGKMQTAVHDSLVGKHTGTKNPKRVGSVLLFEQADCFRCKDAKEDTS